MIKNWVGIGLLGAVMLAGCSNDSASSRTSAVSGTVTGRDGNPVIGARVSVGGAVTFTGPTGSYFLERVRPDDQMIFAEFTQEGIRYRGQNLARTFEGEVRPNVNITIAPERTLARIRGTVRDREGRPLSGVTVFAYGGGSLSSSRALTNAQGDYQINSLAAGFDYEVLANGQGYRADRDQVFLSDGETKILDLQLSEAGFPNMPPPENLTAVTWVSPRATSRSRDLDAQAVEAIKRRWDPKRSVLRSQRSFPNGELVEVVLEWEPVETNELLGYGIYRGRSATGSLASVDFLRETLTGYYVDISTPLQTQSTFFYEVRSLSAQYPDDRPDSESAPSNRVEARILGPLSVGVSLPQVRFSWNEESGATEYVVYVYDREPGIGVNPIAENENSPATGNGWTYSGPALQPNREYYYIVLGLGNNQNSRTVSGVGRFRTAAAN